MANLVALNLNFTRRVALAIAGTAALAAPIMMGILNAPFMRAQSAADDAPKFETASVKPSTGCDPGVNHGASESFSPGRLQLSCWTLGSIIWGAYIEFAFGKHQDLRIVPIEGGPAWMHYRLCSGRPFWP